MSENRRVAARIKPFYDRDFVESALTLSRIEKQGLMLACRALNIGRSIAFVGSGMSSAYGRPTWGHLIETVGNYVTQKCESDNTASDDAKSVAEDLRETTEAVDQSATPGRSDPDLLPLRAQLYRNRSKLAKLGNQDEDFVQRLIKRMTCNDDYTAFAAWSPLAPEDESETAIDLVSDPVPEKWRAYDTMGAIHTALRHAQASAPDPALTEIWEKLISSINKRVGDKEDIRCSAEERLFVALALAASDDIETIRTKIEHYVEPLVSKNLPEDARRDRAFDPIRTLYEDLGIRRILTTNYDFELELGLERLGFERGKLRPLPDKPLPADAPSFAAQMIAQRPLGDRACSMVFSKETAADLTSFAARAKPEFQYEIFHLHGRALLGAQEKLVVTERDYQDAYLRNTPEAHVMDEALTAAMGGNPIIFLGMGMMEADLLRPLRRFVAGPQAQLNRSIVALMPTEEKEAYRTKTAIQLYLRYGVHVIFYDGSSRDAPRTSGQEAPLYLAIAKIAALRDKLNAPGKTIDGTLVEETFNAVRAVLNVCSEPAAECPLQTSLDIATLLLKGASVLDEAWRREHLREFLAMVDGRVRTRALCYALKTLSEDYRQWWRDWREPPKVRTYKPLVEMRQTKSGAAWGALKNRDYVPYLRKITKNQCIRAVRYFVEPRNRAIGSDSEATRAVGEIVRRTNEKRRVFIVHGRAGAGRGAFMHALADGFAKPDRASDDRNDYEWGLFINTTFATEFSSVIDGLNYFLWRCLTPMIYPARGQSLPRRAALIHHLQKIYARSGLNGRRGLILIGGSEVLFRSRDGSPKNFEIVEALAALMHPSLAEFPIDIVLGCRTERCGAVFGDPFNDARRANAAHAEGLRFGVWSHRDHNASFDATLIELSLPATTQRFDARLAQSGEVQSLFKDMDKELPSRNVAQEMVRLGDEETRNSIRPLWPQDWRAAMNGRFAESIILDCTIETLRRASANQQTPKARVNAALKATGQFLSTLGDMRSKANDRAGPGLTIAAVLAQYERLDLLYPSKNKMSSRLSTLILKHLSIISAPVETVVLLHCPEIAAYFETEAIVPEDRLAKLHDHLSWLEERSLVFHVQSRTELQDTTNDVRFRRYVVHQSLQSYFVRRIGSTHIEVGESRLFTVSTFASQPSNVPTPSYATYLFLTALLRSLIGYPQNRPRTPLENDADRRTIEVCALRAGINLVRSTFSLAVVSRFSEYARDNAPRTFGFAEEYRLLLRWMIFQSGMLGIEQADPEETKNHWAALKEVRPAGRKVNDSNTLQREAFLNFRFNALYQDEVTWLYNECGLVSYLQGNVLDALSLLKQALISNELVETKTPNGPNGLRIRLNIALCEIDRGHIDRANELLQAIWRERAREPVIAAIARGYMGVVAHLKRRIEQAQRYYTEAIDHLRGYGDARALSTFLRHLSDLERGRDLKKARQLLSAALAEAETSGQHDLVHRIRVSMARCDLANPDMKPERARSILRQLDEILKYADVMEIHSLKVDALLVRALVISHQGETRTAGEQAVTALSLSTLYGLSLRAVFSMMVLGSLIASRAGYEKQGARLLASAHTMAENYNYQPARESIEALLIDLPDTFHDGG